MLQMESQDAAVLESGHGGGSCNDLDKQHHRDVIIEDEEM